MSSLLSSGVFFDFETINENPVLHGEVTRILSERLGLASLEGSAPTSSAPIERAPNVQATVQNHDDADWLPDLNLSQTRGITDGVSPKVRTTYTVIAQAPESGFRMTDVIEALGATTNNDIRGVWAGITRRLRTVLNDPEANLIHWTWSDELGNWTGRVSAHTHRSLRKVLGLD